MMESTAFFNAKAITNDLSLFLDIDPKKDVIKEFFYDGPKALFYKLELDELKERCLGKSLDEVKKISRDSLLVETLTFEGKKSIAPMGLWLVKEAISNYLGEGRFFKEERDVVCLCFSVTKRDIVSKVLSNRDYELKTLIQDTMASSACGSCKGLVLSIIDETRYANGLIKGLGHSKSRFDKEGKWIKIAGMYPGPLLIKLDELKNEWMQREGIVGQFTIEFVSIEGFHLDVAVNSSNEKTTSGLLLALSDYLKSRLGILFFLQAV